MTAPKAFLPFRIELKPGEAISEQLVYAAEKAILSGLLRPGTDFPSVRAISKDLRIHPNTAQKAITALVGNGYLEVHPGIGTVVARTLPIAARSVAAIEKEAERLILEAKRMRMNLVDLRRIVEAQWQKLTYQ